MGTLRCSVPGGNKVNLVGAVLLQCACLRHALRPLNIWCSFAVHSYHLPACCYSCSEVAAAKYDLNYIGLDGSIGCMVRGL